MPTVANRDPLNPILLDSPALTITPEQDSYIKEILDICCSDSKFAEKAYLALTKVLTPPPVIPPVVASITPNTAVIDSPVTLVVGGSGFIPSSVVVFGGVDAATTFTSDVEITASVTAPSVEGVSTVAVNNDGLLSDPVDFTTTLVAGTFSAKSKVKEVAKGKAVEEFKPVPDKDTDKIVKDIRKDK